MVGCTQGNWGLSVTVIDTRGLPVIREHPGRSHVAPHPHLGGRPGGGVCGHRGHGGHGRKEQGDWGLNRAAHLVVGHVVAPSRAGFLAHRSSIAGSLERVRCE